MKCFNCGESIMSGSLPCPKCGYKFSAGEDRVCPYSNFGGCEITGILCTYGIRWGVCPTKNNADKEGF